MKARASRERVIEWHHNESKRSSSELLSGLRRDYNPKITANVPGHGSNLILNEVLDSVLRDVYGARMCRSGDDNKLFGSTAHSQRCQA